MEYTVGQLVISKSGHDKGRKFLIKAIEGEYLYLIDGKHRPLDHPKKKKIKHVQATLSVDCGLKNKLKNDSYLLDAEIVKTIKVLSCIQE